MSVSPTMVLRLHRFSRMGAMRRAMLAEAALCLAFARIALLILSFQSLARRLGAFVPPEEGRTLAGQALSTADHAMLAREVRWAVAAAARHVPFKAVCLPQAIAAKLMLKRRKVNSVLSFGTIGTPQTALSAHAWLFAAGVPVTGYPVSEFTELACLV